MPKLVSTDSKIKASFGKATVVRAIIILAVLSMTQNFACAAVEFAFVERVDHDIMIVDSEHIKLLVELPLATQTHCSGYHPYSEESGRY